MVAMTKITVEVAYATPLTQTILAVQVEEGCTIQDAIECSGILQLFLEINLVTQPVGIFGHVKKLSSKMQQGDRVEIYRPLLIDPKEARKQRAKRLY